jgi:3-hydroxyisobutyrate dehydrogenase
VITMLTDAAAVTGVMADGTLAAMRDDAVWLQMSTIGIAGIEEAAKLATDRGVGILDAPVLGTKQPAEAGELIVLIGGEDELAGRCRPVFEAVGQHTVELGELGAATRMKLVLNNWLVGLTTALAETVALAEALDLDPAGFLEVIEGGPIDAGYAQLKGKMMIERSFDPAFPLRLAAKDLRLVEEATERHELELPLLAAIAERFAEGVARGNGELDMSATYLTG